MSAKQLEHGQKAIEDKIYRITTDLGLADHTVNAITDGVADFQAYLNSSPRVAWILKEPYDDTSVSGKSCGGGWSIPRDCFNKSTGWKVHTWQRVIYVMYGLKNHLKYAEMDYVRNKPEMGDVLKEIAWLNISKMPAGTTTNSGSLKKAYENVWKPILHEQLDLYLPNVVVFGNTFEICHDLFETAVPIEQVVHNERCYINVFRSNKTILLDAFHPGLRRDVEFYVNSLIDTIRRYS